MGFAGCSAIPLPDISIPMPTLPGFGPPEIPAAMEPRPLAPLETSAAQPAPASVAPVSDKPVFFVQWKPNMPGLTRRPRIAPSSTLPEYPEAARRADDEGVSGVEGCVTVEGRLVDVKLSKSSGSVTLDSATLAWARIAKFEPAEFNGQPMAVCGYGLEHEWRVEGD